VSEPPQHAKHRVGSRLESRAREAVLTRRVFPYLVAVTALIAVGTGIVAHVIDRRDFPTIQDGIWWSIVTLATVGYGDIVPHTTWGRILGGVVIIFGVTFLSFLIATVTSVFVDADREELEATRAAHDDAVHSSLQSIDERLAAIESVLADRPPR
jgi:voltage-gated potassium channel